MNADRRTLLFVALGLGALISGLIAWMWLGDWRWAVTGLGAAVVLMVIGSALARPV